MNKDGGEFPAQAELVIVGGGPGGLACATTLARRGMDVLLLERKAGFGRKVCAGGITAGGMLRRVPEGLLERSFPEQFLFSPRQGACLRDKEPKAIVATVNREKLGTWMATEAAQAGARLRTDAQVLAVAEGRVTVRIAEGKTREIACKHLVGADGAHSLVRRFLRLPSRLFLGLNAHLPQTLPRMEWHLAPRLFGAGYAWVFPHKESVSVGAFADLRAGMPDAAGLRRNLSTWARAQGFPWETATVQAGLTNAEFSGLCFANGTMWLVGDAAGLTSPLTGEGIFPAVASGEAVADMIMGEAEPPELAGILARHRLHHRILAIGNHTPWATGFFSELTLLLLRLGLVDFHRLEMCAPDGSR